MHIKIMEKVGEEKNLVIYGKRSEFELAKEMVMDIIESEVASQFHSQPSMCFRDKTVEKGFQKAKYVAGQVSPTPRSLYLEFEAVLNSDETKLVQSNAEPLNFKCISPLAIRKNRAVLAPFQGDYYRARVLSYTRDDNGVGIYVDFVDFGNYVWVNFLDVMLLEKQFCYPPLATLCQISNIKPRIWDPEALEVFGEILNDSTKHVKVKVYNEYSKSNDVVRVDLYLPGGIGDVGNYLVEREYAEWDNHPFDINDQPTSERCNVTSVPTILAVVTPTVSKPVKTPV